MTKVPETKWLLPLACFAVGVVFLAAAWAGGEPRRGVGALVLMSSIAALFLAGGRSETVRAVRGDTRDERLRSIDRRAGAFAGACIISSLVLLSLLRIARGEGIEPYGLLLAVGAAAYVGALVFNHTRR